MKRELLRDSGRHFECEERTKGWKNSKEYKEDGEEPRTITLQH